MTEGIRPLVISVQPTQRADPQVSLTISVKCRNPAGAEARRILRGVDPVTDRVRVSIHEIQAPAGADPQSVVGLREHRPNEVAAEAVGVPRVMVPK